MCDKVNQGRTHGGGLFDQEKKRAGIILGAKLLKGGGDLENLILLKRTPCKDSGVRSARVQGAA